MNRLFYDLHNRSTDIKSLVYNTYSTVECSSIFMTSGNLKLSVPDRKYDYSRYFKTVKPQNVRDQSENWLDDAIAKLEVKLQNYDEIVENTNLVPEPVSEETESVEQLVARQFYDAMQEEDVDPSDQVFGKGVSDERPRRRRPRRTGRGQKSSKRS